MEHVFVFLVPIACGCVLPIMAIWLITRLKANESKDRTQIVLAAIEKNPNLDIKELMRQMSPRRRPLRERLLSKMMWGSIVTFIGACFTGYGIYGHHANNPFKGGEVNPAAVLNYGWATYSLLFGVILLAVGIALLLYYFIGKRVLAKEMEAERRLTEQA